VCGVGSQVCGDGQGCVGWPCVRMARLVLGFVERSVLPRSKSEGETKQSREKEEGETKQDSNAGSSNAGQ
jgi:hypothetical protein